MEKNTEDQKNANVSAKEDGPEQGRGSLPSLEETSGPVDRGGSLKPKDKKGCVEEASDDSFPASDAPSWSPTAATQDDED